MDWTSCARRSLRIVNNRLVVLKRDEQGSSKGFGSETRYRNTYTFTPRT